MHRYLFYIAIALLAFGIGSFSVYKFYCKSNTVSDNNGSNRINKNLVIERVVNSGISLYKRNPEPAKTEFVCHDEKIKLVWNEILKNKFFLEILRGFDKIDCAEQLEIKSTKLDINGDGINEIVVQGKSGKNFCGMYSGCWFGIFKRTSKGYKSVYTYLDVASFELGKSKSFNHRNLILRSNGRDGRYISILKFNGRNYKPEKCFLETFDYFNTNGQRQTGTKPRTAPIDCAKDL